jgi:hypothetical protein
MLVEHERPATAAPAVRRQGWLMILAFLIFLGWFVLAMSALAQTGVQNTADLTVDQFATIRFGWHAMWVVYAAAVLTGAAATITLTGRLQFAGGGVAATVARILAGVSAVAILGHLVVSQLLAGFDAATLSGDPLWQPQLLLSMAAIWAGMASVVATGIALRVSGVLRRTGLIVAIIAGLILVADVALWGAFPPLIVGIFWLVYGIGLVRRPVPSTP